MTPLEPPSPSAWWDLVYNYLSSLALRLSLSDSVCPTPGPESLMKLASHGHSTCWLDVISFIGCLSVPSSFPLSPLFFSLPPNKLLGLESLSLGLLLGRPKLRHPLTIHPTSLGFSLLQFVFYASDLGAGESSLFAYLCIWGSLLLCPFRLRSLL